MFGLIHNVGSNVFSMPGLHVKSAGQLDFQHTVNLHHVWPAFCIFEVVGEVMLWTDIVLFIYFILIFLS